MRRAHIVLPLTALLVLAVPAGGLAANTSLPRIAVTMTPKAFKRTSTLQVSFTAPYVARSGISEGYELFVIPAKGSRCRTAQKFVDAPFDPGQKLTIRVAPKDVRPGIKGPRWCSGTYRVRLNFQGEDPRKPATGGDGPDGPYVVDDYLIAARELRVK